MSTRNIEEACFINVLCLLDLTRDWERVYVQDLISGDYELTKGCLRLVESNNED